MTLRARLLPLLACPMALAACMVNMEWHVGDGVPLTEIRSVGHFSRIELLCPVPLTIKRGYRPAVTVTADQNLIGYFETYTMGGTLYIEWAASIDPVAVTEVVCILPELAGLVHNENTPVYLEGFPELRTLDLELNGSGDVHFAGVVEHLEARLHGSGHMYLEGDAHHLKVFSSGSGDVVADALWASHAEVDILGSGDVYLALTGGSTLDLVLEGSGYLEWWGLPARTDYHLSGTGKVIEHRQPLVKKAASDRGGRAPRD